MYIVIYFIFVLFWFISWIHVMQAENHQESFARVEKLIPYLIFLFAISALFITLSFFDFNSLLPEGELKQGEINKRSAYGAFGDYLGGILNPIFGFLSLGMLVWTLWVTKKDLSETRNIMLRQERENVLSRLDNSFSRQCRETNSLISTFRAAFPEGSPVFQNKIFQGREVIETASNILFDINNSGSDYGGSLYQNIIMSNRNQFSSYSESLESCFSYLIRSIDRYSEVLSDDQKRYLFDIVNANINYRSTYDLIYILNEASSVRGGAGFEFSFILAINRTRDLMTRFNVLCAPDEIIPETSDLPRSFRVQLWGSPGTYI